MIDWAEEVQPNVSEGDRLDIAKQVFQVHGADARGKTILRKRLRRNQFTDFFGAIPRCVVGMEATRGAHYWARVLGTFGHEVKLIAPQFVKPYVKGQKNDTQDAAAIGEAVSRPDMRFVSQKSIEQQDLQALNRIRSRLLGNRTQLGNQIRRLLAEYGIIVPLHLSQLHLHLVALLDEPHPQLTPLAQELFSSLYEELCAIDQRIEAMQLRISRIFASQEACQKIAEVEGVGPLIATAIVAAIADGRAFRNGRQFAAWLGLVPRQHSSGDKQQLLGISKRGDPYLRMLLIHGARSVVLICPPNPFSTSYENPGYKSHPALRAGWGVGQGAEVEARRPQAFRFQEPCCRRSTTDRQFIRTLRFVISSGIFRS